jgi:hypothetical protein
MDWLTGPLQGRERSVKGQPSRNEPYVGLPLGSSYLEGKADITPPPSDNLPVNVPGGRARSGRRVGYTARPPCLSARPSEALLACSAGRVVRVTERAQVGPDEPQVRMLAYAQ